VDQLLTAPDPCEPSGSSGLLVRTRVVCRMLWGRKTNASMKALVDALAEADR